MNMRRMTVMRRSTAARAAIAAWAVFLSVGPVTSTAQESEAPAADGAAARGEYVFHLGGCVGCHTIKDDDAPRLAGGRAFKTDYGTFYSPNITPDEKTGIGDWTYADFRAAMREGKAPDGSNYFPAFPYTSYTRMTEADMRDLWAYLQAQPAIERENTPHDLKPVFGWRWLMPIWNWLYLDEGPRPDWSRGRYLAEALGHCHECHTPRNILGGPKTDMTYAGTPSNPEGIEVPNITPHEETGIGSWSDGDLKMLFTIGMLPDADFVGGVMAESVSHITSKMTEADRQALIAYLRTLEPIENKIGTEKPTNSGGQSW